MYYVYVAGPYSGGDPVLNVRNAIAVADALLEAGFCPFVPHLCHGWHMVSPKAYEAWMAWDVAWLQKCDVLLRLPGKSPGADWEEHLAVDEDAAEHRPCLWSRRELPVPAGICLA